MSVRGSLRCAEIALKKTSLFLAVNYLEIHNSYPK